MNKPFYVSDNLQLFVELLIVLYYLLDGQIVGILPSAVCPPIIVLYKFLPKDAYFRNAFGTGGHFLFIPLLAPSSIARH